LTERRFCWLIESVAVIFFQNFLSRKNSLICKFSQNSYWILAQVLDYEQE